MDESKKTISNIKNMIAAFIKAIGLIIFFCGVPGICVVLLSYFILSHVSHERKQEVIDAMKLVIENDKASMLLLYLVVGLLAVVFIYNDYWKGREKLLLRRMKEPEKSLRLNQPESINKTQ
jgi:hypothetical protein